MPQGSAVKSSSGGPSRKRGREFISEETALVSKLRCAELASKLQCANTVMSKLAHNLAKMTKRTERAEQKEYGLSKRILS
jgi:hypothetical protein